MSKVATSEVTVKAVPVNGLCEFVSKELTPAQYEKVISSFPPEYARYLRGHILAHESVPLSIVDEFTAKAAAEKGEPLKQFGRRAGRYGAELGLKSVYKFMMMLMSIESVLKKAPFMWSRVYDSGVMKVTTGKNTARITVEEFPGEPAVCSRITGWFEVIGEKAGAKDLRTIHTSCVGEGGSLCSWDFTWRD